MVETIRFRTARYISKKLKESNVCSYDAFQLLKARKACFYKEGGKWVGRLQVRGVYVFRRHKNILKLGQILSQHIITDEMIQGQLAVKEGPGVELDIKCEVEIPYTRPQSLNYLKPRGKGKLDDSVDKIFKKHLTDHVYDEVTNGYMHSTAVTDKGLKEQALKQLIREKQDYDLDELTNDLIMSFATTEPLDGVYITKAKAADYADIPTKNTSSGAINLDPFCGAVGGKKFDLQASASLAAEAGTPMLNGEAHSKGEVIKAGKKVRQIICQAYPIYLKAAHYLEHKVNRKKNLCEGRASGIVFKGGGMYEILRSLWLDELEFQDIEFEDFLDLLEAEGLDESDIKAFEANINDATGIVYLAELVASYKNLCAAAIPDVAQVLCDYAAMPVKYDGHKCYYAFLTVGSGQYTTEDGNSRRQLIGYQRASWKIQLHERECQGCPVCPYADCSWHDLAILVGGAVLGDDRIMRHFPRDLGPLMKHCLGCEVVSEHKKAFAGNGNSAEFLRRGIDREGNLYREPIRLLAKLYHGDAKRDGRTFGAAITSASIEMGPQDDYRPLLEDLLSLLREEERTLTDRERDLYGLTDEVACVHSAYEVETFVQPSDENLLSLLRDYSVLMK